MSKSVQKRLAIQTLKERIYYKVVLMPIRVPTGEYCWDYKPPRQVCEHFDNEGGTPHCDLGFCPLKEDRKRGGVLKPKECLELKVI